MTAGAKPGWCLLHGDPEPCFKCNNTLFRPAGDLGLSPALAGTVMVAPSRRAPSGRRPVFVAVRASQAPERTFAYPVADPVFADRVVRVADGDLSWLADVVRGLPDGGPVADPRCGCGCGR